MKDKPGREQVKDLWKQSKNTLFFCVGVLSSDNMRNLVALILEICRPVWTAHSDQARIIRAPENVQMFYREYAVCSYLEPLEASAQVFLNTLKLEDIVFAVIWREVCLLTSQTLLHLYRVKV